MRRQSRSRPAVLPALAVALTMGVGVPQPAQAGRRGRLEGDSQREHKLKRRMLAGQYLIAGGAAMTVAAPLAVLVGYERNGLCYFLSPMMFVNGAVALTGLGTIVAGSVLFGVGKRDLRRLEQRSRRTVSLSAMPTRHGAHVGAVVRF